MFGCVSICFCWLGNYWTKLGLCNENLLMQKLLRSVFFFAQLDFIVF